MIRRTATRWSTAVAMTVAIIIGTTQAGDRPDHQFGEARKVAVFRTLHWKALQFHQETFDDYLKSAESKCIKQICKATKQQCRLLHLETKPECSEKDVGWTCSRMPGTGCFCAGSDEKPQGVAQIAAGAPTPSETSAICPNEFDDPVTLGKDGSQRAIAEALLAFALRGSVAHTAKRAAISVHVSYRPSAITVRPSRCLICRSL